MKCNLHGIRMQHVILIDVYVIKLQATRFVNLLIVNGLACKVVYGLLDIINEKIYSTQC